MALTTQDFDHGVDFTGLANVTGGDLNNGIDLAQPHKDDANSSRGLVITTKDSALNVPVVPDANTHDKWKQYIWQRTPFDGNAPIHYGWNEDAVADATYLKWLQTEVDFTELNTAINAAANLATIAKTEADQAIALAQAVNTVANAASTNATNALTAANSAVASATAANATATTANAAATAATAAANAATATANAVTTAQNTYASKHNIAILAEQSAAGVDLGGLNAGTTNRNINTEVYDASNIVTLAGGKITITNAGTYVFDISVPYVPDLTGANSQHVQAMLINDADGTVLGRGTSSCFEFTGIGGVNCLPTLHSFIRCVIVATAAQVVKVVIKAGATNGVLGKASNLGGNEEYTLVRIEQIA